MNRRPALLLVFLVAVPLVATPLYAFPTAGQPTYTHSIEPIDQNEIPADVTVRQYAALSPEARQAVDAALESDDGTAAVRGEANEPPEFSYDDTIAWGEGRYVIDRGGDYYEVTTYASGGIDFSPITERLLQLLGLLVGAVWIGAARYDRERTAVAVAGIASVPLAATVVHSAGLAEIGALVLFAALGALCAAVAGLGVVTPRRVGIGVTGLLVLGVGCVAAVTGLGLFVVGPAALIALSGLVAAVFVGDPTPS